MCITKSASSILTTLLQFEIEAYFRRFQEKKKKMFTKTWTQCNENGIHKNNSFHVSMEYEININAK